MSWTKIDNLTLLREARIPGLSVGAFISFTVKQWRKSREAIIRNLVKENLGKILIIRSCAYMEDGRNSPPPGYFESVLGVDGQSTNDLEIAITKVVSSYSKSGRTENDLDKVFVQSQLNDCVVSGVAHLSPNGYIRLNLAKNGAETDAVTSGREVEYIVISSGSYPADQNIDLLKNAIINISTVFKPPIWIEFGVDGHNNVHIFQVRQDWTRKDNGNIKSKLLVDKLIVAAQYQVLKHGPLSNMSDWNPAELLGPSPGQLDISLYKNLVTDSAWLEGRVSLGWRLPKGDSHLVCEVMNRPYIILRKSLESLLPGGLPNELADKLVNYHLQEIKERPDKHDKIEFEVVNSAFAIDTQSVRNSLLAAGFTLQEIVTYYESLKGTTKKAFNLAMSVINHDKQYTSDEYSPSSFKLDKETPPKILAQHIEKTLLQTSQLGVVQFSRQARLAFMCNFVIRRMLEVAPSERRRVQRWIESLDTVTSIFKVDIGRLRNKEIPKSEFDTKYGFLRPNSYNIESLTYSERSDFFLKSIPKKVVPKREVNAIENKWLEAILSDIDKTLTSSSFWEIASSSYQLREKLKFQFSSDLSALLDTLVDLSKFANISRTDLRMYRIEEIIDMLYLANSFEEFGKNISRSHKYRCIKNAKLFSTYVPDLIMEPIDLRIIREITHRPTYIGETIVEDEIIIIDPTTDNVEIDGKIVVIDCPDPGYEWIFGQDIVGMITGYGGAFSHIALRCSEINISAVIGTGLRFISTLESGEIVRIDPTTKSILRNISSGSYGE